MEWYALTAEPNILIRDGKPIRIRFFKFKFRSMPAHRRALSVSLNEQLPVAYLDHTSSDLSIGHVHKLAPEAIAAGPQPARSSRAVLA
jgi:hypothetical protein